MARAGLFSLYVSLPKHHQHPVKEILQPGANDVWVVKRKGKKDLLLPYIPPVVLDVDVAAGRIEVELMEGLDDED